MTIQTPRNLFLFVVSLLIAVASIASGEPRGERVPIRHPHGREAPQHANQAVRHDTKFKSVPDAQLQIRAVEYDGATNGSLTVQVKNTGKTAHKFTATGLYFVPDGDPDSAPQRLGAVGPMQLASSPGKELQELEIAAGATVEVKLDVFCIDSHRSSPSPRNSFAVGAKRLPKELSRTIEKSADDAVAEERAAGRAAPRPAAKGKIQGKVWESRDAKWVPLDGEGKQEAAKRR